MHVKMFATGMAAVITCAIPLVLDDVNQSAAEQAAQQADARSADELQLARELPSNPPDVAGAFVDLLAEGGTVAAQDGCLLFDAQAAAQFAVDQHATACVAAMVQLQTAVTDRAAYEVDLSVPETAWTVIGTTATLNGCVLSWSGAFTDTPTAPPGPLPGQWTLTQLDGQGWQITQYAPC